jgi:hypothetical protein
VRLEEFFHSRVGTPNLNNETEAEANLCVRCWLSLRSCALVCKPK